MDSISGLVDDTEYIYLMRTVNNMYESISYVRASDLNDSSD